MEEKRTNGCRTLSVALSLSVRARSVDVSLFVHLAALHAMWDISSPILGLTKGLDHHLLLKCGTNTNTHAHVCIHNRRIREDEHTKSTPQA